MSKKCFVPTNSNQIKAPKRPQGENDAPCLGQAFKVPKWGAWVGFQDRPHHVFSKIVLNNPYKWPYKWAYNYKWLSLGSKHPTYKELVQPIHNWQGPILDCTLHKSTSLPLKIHAWKTSLSFWGSSAFFEG